MKTIRIVAILMSLAIALVVLGAPVAARSPMTRYVDDDGTAGRSGCNGTRSVPRKVQRAIHVAGPGDTILVCPGTYTEHLSITGARDGLTIRAVKPWTAIIRTPGRRTRAQSPLITIDAVDRVRVLWLQLAIRTAAPCEWVPYGVLIRSAQEAQIRGLRIEPLGSNTLGPCGYHIGILVEGRASAFLGYNEIRDFEAFGIVISGTQATATVYRNSIRFFHAAEAADANSASDGFGIYAVKKPRVTIRANVIRSGPGAGLTTPALGTGMSLQLGDGSVVARNTVQRTTFGIVTQKYALPAPRARVEGNMISEGSRIIGGPPTYGMDVHDSSAYSGNRVSGYDVGVHVGDESGGYSGTVPALRGNDFRGNLFDCTDEGAYYGHPAIWIHNLGDTSDPPGICSPTP